jgi:hypothetical protein
MKSKLYAIIQFVLIFVLSGCSNPNDDQCMFKTKSIWSPDDSWSEENRSNRVNLFLSIEEKFGKLDDAYQYSRAIDHNSKESIDFFENYAFYYLSQEIIHGNYERIDWYLHSGTPVFKEYPAIAPIYVDVEVSKDPKILALVEKYYSRDEYPVLTSIDWLIDNCRRDD